MTVRVLIFTQYFTPEIGATQTRVHTLAAGLARAGHDVEVLCEIPNHPQGVVHPGFRGRPLIRRRLDGFRVLYLWVAASTEKTLRTRLAFYGSYAMMATLVGAARPRPDVVFASSPPLPVAAAAAIVAARHRVPWVLDVRDLWPAAAVAMGELAHPGALALAERLEMALYRNAAAITVVTDAFRRDIGGRLGDDAKLTVVPNGTTRLWIDGADLEVDRHELALPGDRFVWTFAGNVGTAQGLEAAVRAAALLDGRFHLLILGDGPARARLEALARELRAAVEFRSQVPPLDARRHLRASDALLVSLDSDPALAAFVPSKLYDCCAVGRPVVLAADGEARRLTEENVAAVVVPPGDPAALAEAIRRLEADSGLRQRVTRAGRAFAAGNLREPQVERVEAVLEAVSRGV